MHIGQNDSKDIYNIFIYFLQCDCITYFIFFFYFLLYLTITNVPIYCSEEEMG